MSKGFNFGQIGDIISQVMDSDYIDIKRDVSGSLEEIYSNILCHISYNSTDNPDPNSVDTKPIIQSITINLPNWVDIKNNDFIVAKKMGNDGKILTVYSGRCGNPVVSQARKKVIMNMSGTDSEDPTPVPPENPARIEINYFSDNEKIQDTIYDNIEVGSEFNMPAPIIEGYKAVNCTVDGIEQQSTTAYIPSVLSTGHKIDFIYEKSNEVDKYSFLVNGLYTKDDGGLANGYHLYKKIPIDLISKSNSTYTITSENIKSIHEDNGKILSIQVGTKLVLLPGKIFVVVNEILQIQGNKITFVVSEFTPTADEKNAYVTRWYD